MLQLTEAKTWQFMSTGNYEHEICDSLTYLQGLEEPFASSGALTTWVFNMHF